MLLQQRLGCPGGAAFSQAACSGFIYALSVADKFIKCGEARHALVVGAETMSRITDWTDRGTAILFADGAGAVVLKGTAEPGILSTHLHADGVLQGSAVLPRRGRHPHGRQRGVQDRPSPIWARPWKNASRRIGLERSAVDWLVPHQANIRIIKAAARRLDLPLEKVIVTVQDHGNTSAASIPLALDTGVRDGRVKRGELLLAGGLRRRLHLGFGADPLLKKATPRGARRCSKQNPPPSRRI